MWKALVPCMLLMTLMVFPVASYADDNGVVGDKDSDGVEDSTDNCVNVSNPSQFDADDDGWGDACDTDIDGDDVLNDVDNCAKVYNREQQNDDNDPLGNACDKDDDNDGLSDDIELRLGTNPSVSDTDDDGFDDSAEVLAGTSPLLYDDYPGHERPEDGSFEGTGAGDCAYAGSGGRALSLVMLGIALLTLLALRRGLRHRSIACLFALAGSGLVAFDAHAEPLATRVPITGDVGPYLSLIRGVRGKAEHFVFTSSYMNAREPLVYMLPSGQEFAKGVDVAHEGRLSFKTFMAPRVAFLLSSDWTVSRSGDKGFEEMHESGLGDLTLGISLYSPSKEASRADPLELGHMISAYWMLPTGDNRAFRGDGATGAGFLYATDLEGRYYGLISNLGFEYRHTGLEVESTGLFRYGLGVATFTSHKHLSFAVEWTGRVFTDGGLATNGFNAVVAHEQEHWFIRAGAGSDLPDGPPGSTSLRVIVETGFSI